MNFGTGVVDKKRYRRSKSFRDYRYCDSHDLLKGFNELVPYFPDLLTDLGEIRYNVSPPNAVEQV
jgi:hypothetical protein